MKLGIFLLLTLSFGTWIILVEGVTPSTQNEETRVAQPQDGVSGGNTTYSKSSVPLWFDEITLNDAVRMGGLEAARYRVTTAGDNTTAWNSRGYAPIHEASYFSRLLPLLQYLVEEVGVDVNSGSKRLRTPLHFAASYGQLDVIQYLVGKGANVTAQDEIGETPLHEAVRFGTYLCVEYLADAAGTNLDAEDNLGNTPLHVAASTNDFLSLRVLLGRGASPDTRNKKGETPLHKLVSMCELTTSRSNVTKIAIQTIIKNGGNMSAQNGDGDTPLHLAVKGGCELEFIQFLVGLGADPGVKNGEGKTPLELSQPWRASHAYLQRLGNASGSSTTSSTTTTTELSVTTQDPGTTPPVEYQYLTLGGAIEAKSVDGLRYRVQSAGDNVTADLGYGLTPIHLASATGYLPVVQYLVEEARVGVEFRNTLNRTPMHYAARGSSLDVLKYLVGRGGSVRVADSEGNTPLHEAADEIALEPVEYLVSNGADVHARNADGGSPLHLAARNCFINIVSFLVDHGAGASLNLKSKYDGVEGKTPFHLASSCSERDPFYTLKYLARKGADVKTRDGHGNTPLHNAIKGGSLRAVKFLVESWVVVNAKNKDGSTPLHVLAELLNEQQEQQPKKGSVDILKYLVETGVADLGAENNQGHKPSQLYRGSSEEIKRLLAPAY